MEKLSKSEIRHKLASNNETIKIQIINFLKENGSVDFLPDLLSIYGQSEPINNEIYSIFRDIKRKEAADIISSLIIKSNCFKIKFMLVSSCWQNGLDYSNNLQVFTDLLILNDFNLAFEAFTVIENQIDFLNESKTFKLIELLKTNINQMSENISICVNDLIAELNNHIKSNLQ